jgi:hypothetical protein
MDEGAQRYNSVMWLDNWNLNRTCSIYRRTIVKNGKGGSSYSLTTLALNEPCQIWQASAIEQLVHDQIKNPAQFVCVLEPSTEYRATDILVSDGTTYKITKPDNVLNEGDIMVIGLAING